MAKDFDGSQPRAVQVIVGCGLAIDKGLMTRPTAVRMIASIAGQFGVAIDAEVELAAVQAEAATAAEADVFTTPAAADA